MKQVYFKTFGCRSNAFDTQVMKENLRDFVITNNEEEADIIIINSCSVTNGADADVQHYINRCKGRNKKVFLTGCGIENAKKNFDSKLIFGVFPHSQKESVNSLLVQNKPFYRLESNQAHLDSTIIKGFSSRSRAFVKIQEGCNFSCSFCIIPSLRGRARSLDEEFILKQVAYLLDNDVQEIILTGTNVGSYGIDKKRSLADLVEKIFKLTALKRLRIGSMETTQIDSKMLEVMSDERYEKHVHLALQYTHDDMLKLMRRVNRVERDLNLVSKLNSMGFFVGTDFIVAHPGETQSLWSMALENFKHFNLTHIHPFIYSPRENTLSAKMQKDNKDYINGRIAKARLHELKELCRQENLARRKTNRTKNMPLKVLIESKIDEDKIEKIRHIKSFLLDSSAEKTAHKPSQKTHFYQGLDQFFNKTIISSTDIIETGSWLKVRDYHIALEGNYAKK